MMIDERKPNVLPNRTAWLWAGLFLFIIHPSSFSQIGVWQTHFSYRSAKSVAVVGDKVYAATQNGFFYYDRTANETVTLSKVQGLSDVGISRLLYLTDQKRLLIGYQNGNLDLLTVSDAGEPGTVKNVNTILAAPNLPASRSVNYLNRVGNTVYISTSFGLVVFDPVKDEIRDTYFSPVPNGSLGPALYATAVANDTLFALSASARASVDGFFLQAVRLAPTVNLADPANWRLIPAPGQPLTSIVTNQGNLLASVSGRGIYERQNGQWVLTRPLPGQNATLFPAADGYLVATNQTITRPNSVTFAGPLVLNPREVVPDGNRVWVADEQSGLLAGVNGAFTPIVPNGPSSDQFTILYAYPQRLVASSEAATRGPNLDLFLVPDGRWQNLTVPNTGSGFSAAAYLPTEQRLYIGARGLWRLTDSLLAERLTLPNSVDPNLTINALAADAEGNLWIATRQRTQGKASLYVRRPDGSIQAFPTTDLFGIERVIPDDYGFLWLITDGRQLAVFDPQTNRSRLSVVGVNALVKDRTGVIWIGTERGPLVFDNPADAFDERVTPQAPLLSGRRLLANESITTIAVDGSNRKWLGTRNGLYHVAPDGSQLLETFTSANSPLPDNSIDLLAIEPLGGKVFILTPKGLVSYQGTATEPAETLSRITIYPNPVRPDFTGTVGINGLTDNATVKVLDAGGQLVYETRSQGGTATWSLRDYRGRPAQTGVYLVVVIAPDGSEGLAGKLAIVR